MSKWTAVQKQRLQELGASSIEMNFAFRDAAERNIRFQEIEQSLVHQGREMLEKYRSTVKTPALNRLENHLAETLISNGFCRVSTPILLSKGLLARMTITEKHPLFEQVFWVDSNKCLRPMLAPNLYYILKDLLRLWPKPVSIFEIGPCFRKDSQGGSHMQEFTMLNLVEMGLVEENRTARLEELAELVLTAAGLADYRMDKEESEVYGETIDLTVGGMELGSGAMGPHALDERWGINVPWVGIGFGLERLVMAGEGFENIQRAGRSLTYLDGIRLNI